MGASLGTLVSQTTILIGLVSWLLPIEISIVEHMDANKVRHFIVHFFSFTKLKCEILVFFVLL
jgi:hypothetical protein